MADQVTAGRFVGRTQELARLRQLLACAAAGTPLLALVGGEAGVGKTRLAEQFVPAAQEQAPACWVAVACRWARRACRSRRSCKRLKCDAFVVERKGD